MIFRIIFGMLILVALFTGSFEVAAFNTVIFLVTLLLPYLARYDDEYKLLDEALMVMFSLAVLVSMFFNWEYVFFIGIDTAFHLAGGFFVGWFAAIFFKKQRTNMYILAVLCTALVIGVGWEVFEWVFSWMPDIISVPFDPQGIHDSIKDLVADMLGACALVLWKCRHKLFK
ncbi:MAG: hypothetical protein OXR66_02810 [Candidatus Woesearchaeota archaeon]|nr:hypothetical protein [Candidatus Woesearchaeota archaeon]